jgi:hypothetical protein
MASLSKSSSAGAGDVGTATTVGASKGKGGMEAQLKGEEADLPSALKRASLALASAEAQVPCSPMFLRFCAEAHGSLFFLVFFRAGPRFLARLCARTSRTTE